MRGDGIAVAVVVGWLVGALAWLGFIIWAIYSLVTWVTAQ